MRPGRAADHPHPSSAAVMDPLGHTGPVTRTLIFFYLYNTRVYSHITRQTKWYFRVSVRDFYFKDIVKYVKPRSVQYIRSQH